MSCKSESEQLADTINAVGPKVFKTKDVEIESHSIASLYDLHRKLQIQTPNTFCQLRTCVAEPKCE